MPQGGDHRTKADAMNAHAAKSPQDKKDKNQSSISGLTSKQSGRSTSGLSSNRAEAAAQRRVLAMANTGYRAMQLKNVQEMADDSRQVRTMTQLQVIADAASQSKRSNQVAVVQRVLIGGVNITSKTPRKEIEKVLQWTSKMYGIPTELSTEQRQQLITELEQREDCSDILEVLREDLLEEEHEPSNKGSSDDGSGEEESLEADLLKLSPFSGTTSTESKEEARRRKAAEDFGWLEFPETFRGLTKIGVHETASGNVESLVAKGPSPGKLGTGRGLGKGPGFYVTHVGQKTLYNAIKGISWGERFVAVYVPSDMMAIKSTSEETNNTGILDKIHGGEFCYYIMSGGSEVVIPVRSFGLVTLVSKAYQLVSHDDDEDEQVQAVYTEELDFARRMNTLSTQYNATDSPRRRQAIAKKWNWLQKVLFNRWSMNGRLYTLWLDTMTVGELVAAPRRPR
jgi:hypothetical protein